MSGQPSLAYVHEPVGDYRAKNAGSPSDTTYKYPGKNVTFDDITIENALTRIRLPETNEAYESVVGNFEGAFGASWVITNPWFLNHVFGQPPTSGGESAAPYSYTWEMVFGQMQSSRWYVGIDYFDGTAERELKGVVFGSMEVNLTVGDPVRVSCTGFYGDEAKNTSLTPGSSISGKDDPPIIFHDGSIQIDSTAVDKVQEATLEVSNGARPERTLERKPIDAVTGNVEHTFTPVDILSDTNQLTLAYGNASAPVTDRLNGAGTGVLDFQAPGDSALTFNLSGLKPNTYGWDNPINKEESLTEETEYFVNSVTATAESSESTAL